MRFGFTNPFIRTKKYTSLTKQNNQFQFGGEKTNSYNSNTRTNTINLYLFDVPITLLKS